MADTETFTSKLDNEIAELHVLLNENNATLTRDELTNNNIRIMEQKKRIKEIVTENIVLNRIMQLYNLGIFSV